MSSNNFTVTVVICPECGENLYDLRFHRIDGKAVHEHCLPEKLFTQDDIDARDQIIAELRAELTAVRDAYCAIELKLQNQIAKQELEIAELRAELDALRYELKKARTIIKEEIGI